MSALLLAMLLMPAAARAEFTPLPADTPESINQNFKNIDEEVRRLDQRISTPTFTTIYFTNGSTQTGGATPSFTNFNSSCTIIPNVTGTNSVFGVAAATVTMTLGGQGDVWCTFSGLMVNSIAGNNVDGNVLYDGAYMTIGGFTYQSDPSTGGGNPLDGAMMSAQVAGNSYAESPNTNRIFPHSAISAGTHNFAIQFCNATNGTWTVDQAYGVKNVFCCLEFAQ